MKTSVILIAMLVLVAAPTAIAAPTTIAAPEPTASALGDPVELYPCFNGGVTIVVRGTVVAECLGG